MAATYIFFVCSPTFNVEEERGAKISGQFTEY